MSYDQDWLSTLNIISPTVSPTTGPADETLRSESALSFPVPTDELSAHLEAWTNTEFRTSSTGAPSGPLPTVEDSDDLFAHLYKKPSSAHVFQQSFSGSGLTSSASSVAPGYFTSAAGQSSVDPLLFGAHAPFFNHQLTALDGSNIIYPSATLNNMSGSEKGQPAVTSTALPPPPHTKGVGTPSDTGSSVETPAGSTNATVSPSAFTTKSSEEGKTTKGGKRGRKPLLAASLDASDADAAAAALAIEQDKRRRNTAASARFRVKKKQKEQALEMSAKQLSDRVKDLEKQLDSLRMENQWLRSLITEKAKGPGEEAKA